VVAKLWWMECVGWVFFAKRMSRFAVELPSPGSRAYNATMSERARTEEDATPRVWGMRPVVAGTLAGGLSAIGYTAANVCLRSVTGYDSVWVSAVKAVPTVALVGPIVLARMLTGRRVASSAWALVMLTTAGLFGQLAGNVSFQWALGVVGLAMTVPLVFGTMIVTGAALGWQLLGERVSPQVAVACAILIGAITVLAFGAPGSRDAVAAERNGSRKAADSIAAGQDESIGSLRRLSLGVGAACLAGFAYAMLGIAIRKSTSSGTPVSTVLTIVGLCGVIGLGTATAIAHPQAPVETEPADLTLMLMAGAWNAVAFGALSIALQLTTVTYVNALNASQVAMAAVAGVVYFSEPITATLIFGITLTILGLLMMRRKRSAQENTQDDDSATEDALPAPRGLGDSALATEDATAGSR